MKKALKKALFIDRDGTLIVEPPVDMQVDSLAKLEFVPGAISALKVLRGCLLYTSPSPRDTR